MNVGRQRAAFGDTSVLGKRNAWCDRGWRNAFRGEDEKRARPQRRARDVFEK